MEEWKGEGRIGEGREELGRGGENRGGVKVRKSKGMEMTGRHHCLSHLPKEEMLRQAKCKIC